MGKLLQLLSLSALVFVGVGTWVIPNNPMFWLASGATSYQYVRLALGILLLFQIFTQPPRQPWFRIVAGLVALGTGAWALQQTGNFHMQPVDTLAYLSASLAIFITALERRLPVLAIEPEARQKQGSV